MQQFSHDPNTTFQSNHISLEMQTIFALRAMCNDPCNDANHITNEQYTCTLHQATPTETEYSHQACPLSCP